MKKNITLLLLSFFVFPSLVFASWWNPFSWFSNWSFSKPNEQTEITNKTEELERKVKELEDKLNKNDTESVVSKPAPTNNAKVINSQPIIKPQTAPEIVVTDMCPNIDGVQGTVPTGFNLYANTKTCLTEKEIEKYEELQSQAIQYQNKLKEDDAKYKQQVNKINNIKQQIIDLNVKYLDDKEVISKNAEGLFGGGLNQKLQDLYNKYTSDYDYLSLQYQQAMLDLDNY